MNTYIEYTLYINEYSIYACMNFKFIRKLFRLIIGFRLS